MNIQDIKSIQKIALQAMKLIDKYVPEDYDDDNEDDDEYEDE